jgi:hypothetical protein
VATREFVGLPAWLREVNGHRATLADLMIAFVAPETNRGPDRGLQSSLGRLPGSRKRSSLKRRES